MSNKWLAKHGLFWGAPRVYPLLLLLLAYFLCRLFFQQFEIAKTAFIFPTGLFVEMFYGAGEYVGREWLFSIDRTQFVLGESCSGTTFFSLLAAYVVFRMKTHGTSFVWLLLAYPLALVANTMRVLSSIYAHETLALFDGHALDVYVHVVVGAMAFLCSFLMIAYVIERPNVRVAV